MPQFSLFWFVAGAVVAYFLAPRIIALIPGGE